MAFQFGGSGAPGGGFSFGTPSTQAAAGTGFGTPSTQLPAFSFNTPAASTPAFGGTAPSLFGGASQPSATPSLFGGTPQTGAGGFGAPAQQTTASAPGFSFGQFIQSITKSNAIFF